MTKTEEHNLKEEIREEIKKSLRNDIDNEGCAVFRVARKDHYSPRGKAIILDNEYYEKILYKCNLCKGCGDELCSSFQKARQVMVLKGNEMNANKIMIENLRKSGNVYGIQE